jgi:hypothetical protein
MYLKRILRSRGGTRSFALAAVAEFTFAHLGPGVGQTVIAMDPGNVRKA